MFEVVPAVSRPLVWLLGTSSLLAVPIAPLACGADEGFAAGPAGTGLDGAAAGASATAEAVAAPTATAATDPRCASVVEPCRACVNANCCDAFASCDDLDTCTEIVVCLRSCSEALLDPQSFDDDTCLGLCGADAPVFAAGIARATALIACQLDACEAECQP